MVEQKDLKIITKHHIRKFHNWNNHSLQIPTTNKVLKEEATCHPGSWRAFENMCQNTTVLITKTIYIEPKMSSVFYNLDTFIYDCFASVFIILIQLWAGSTEIIQTKLFRKPIEIRI